MRNKFERGSGCYKCRDCGKLTRETGECESGSQLCRSCYELVGLENQHNDSHNEKVSGCMFCEKEGK